MIKNWMCHCGNKNKVGEICTCKDENCREELIKLFIAANIRKLGGKETTIYSLSDEILSKFELKPKRKETK